MTTESINALLIAPVGSVVAWPGPLSTIPNNWKLCNGEYLLASAFPDLLQVVQDYWGEYDGSGATQSFKLPDLRGVFLRGVNEERNDDYMDPEKDSRPSSKGISNEVGSYQMDSIQSHNHSLGKSSSDKQAHSQMERDRFADFVQADAGRIQVTSEPKSARVSIETRSKNAYVNYIIRAL